MNKLKFIIIDRLTRARDNGEYFYRYLRENHPEIEIIFGLHPNSKDWPRLKNDEFNLVDLTDLNSLKIAIKNCTHFLFSESNEGYKVINPLLDRTKVIYVYLNHGCFFARGNICYPIKKFDLMICGNKREYDSVIYNAHKNGLPITPYLLTGLPRMDVQVLSYKMIKNKNLILIQPWWRNNLTGWKVVENTNKIDDIALAKLSSSDFVKGYNALLNDERFEKICKDNNLEVAFKRHPVMENIPGVFKVPDWIIDEPSDLFIDLFSRTKLYITDYSSNAFETANLTIPCIYFEPDYKNLVVDCNRPEWAWNVKTDGLGPVAFDVDTFIGELTKLINNNFSLEQTYIARRNEQLFAVLDTANCERCFKAIIDRLNIKSNTNQPVKAYGQANAYLYF